MDFFDVHAVRISVPAKQAYEFIAKPENLPRWTEAFKRADAKSAQLETEHGRVEIGRQTIADTNSRTIDWEMAFPDGSVGWAYSRITDDGKSACIYSFVPKAPPGPLETIEGALTEQKQTLKPELMHLRTLLEQR